MKTCIIAFGTDRETATAVSQSLTIKLARKGIPNIVDATILILNLEWLQDTLEHDVQLPDDYVKADVRILVGVDQESYTYLQQVKAALEEAQKASIQDLRVPLIPQMHDDVLEEFLKAGQPTTAWGPKIVDGYNLYLDTVVNLACEHLTKAPPPAK